MSDAKRTDVEHFSPAQFTAAPAVSATPTAAPAAASAVDQQQGERREARRNFSQIRRLGGTTIAKLFRRQQTDNSRREGEESAATNAPTGGDRSSADQQQVEEEVAVAVQQPQQEQHDQPHKHDDSDGTVHDAEQQQQWQVSDGTGKQQRNNADANDAGGGHAQAVNDNGATSHGATTAPEARQKWGRRRSSVVHPLETDQQREQMPSAKRPMPPMGRPPTVFRLGPSSPTPWIYLQMADRSFRRTTVAQLQADEHEHEGQKRMGVPLSTDGQMLAPEFASVRSALIVQNNFHRLALIVQGFIAGLTFGHTMFAFLIADLEFMKRGTWMAVPVQAFFHLCLSICIVEALDRFEFGSLWRSLCSLPSVGITACFSAFLASISSAQIGQLLAQQTVDEGNEWNAEVLFVVWQLLSAVRAACTLLAWLTMAIRPTANATRETLAKMLPSNSVP